jgi:uncharacterized protein (DUF1330 family)
MTVYAIAQGKIENRERFDQYVAEATPTLIAHDAKVLAVDESPVIVEGNVDYPRTVVIEFESEAAFRRWYDSPEYTAARRVRLDAAQGTFILVKALQIGA